MSTDPSPTEQALSSLERLQEAYSIIGGIIVCWGRFERAISDAVHTIETITAMHAQVYPIPYTDLKSLRGLKERKGRLRALVELHGSKENLRELDKLYRTMVKPEAIRHACGHEVVSVNEEVDPPSISTYNSGDRARRIRPSQETYLISEIRDIYCKMHPVPFIIKDLSYRVAGEW